MMVSIKIKFVSIVLICVVLTSVLVGGLAISKSTDLLEKQAKEELMSKTENVANKILTQNKMVETAVSDLGTIMSTGFDYDRAVADREYLAQFSDGLNPIARKMLENIGGEGTGIYTTFDVSVFSDFVYGPWYIIEDGEAVQQEAESVDVYDPSDEGMIWYYGPIDKGQGMWTPVYVDTASGGDVSWFSYVAPFYTQDGRLVGISGIDIGLEDISSYVTSVKIYEDGFSFLIDQDNKFIVEPKHDIDPALISELLTKKEAMQQGFVSDGEFILSFVKLPNNQVVASFVSVSEVTRQVSLLRNQIIGITIALGMLIALVGYFLTSAITKRIMALRDVSKDVIDGNLDTAVPQSKAHDEITDLTIAIEMLIAGFKAKSLELDAKKAKKK